MSLQSRLLELNEAIRLMEREPAPMPLPTGETPLLLSSDGHRCIPKIVANRPPVEGRGGRLTLKCIACGRKSLTEYASEAEYKQLLAVMRAVRVPQKASKRQVRRYAIAEGEVMIEGVRRK